MTTFIIEPVIESEDNYHDHSSHTPIKLSTTFLDKYTQQESPLSPMGRFVFYRTYSRFSSKLGRRETWAEAC